MKPTKDKLILRAIEEGRFHVNVVTGDVHVCVNRKNKSVATSVNNQGYIRINTRIDGKQVTLLSHRIVAIAAFGMPPGDDMEVNHKNGVKTDNRACNLEWVSGLENVQHACANGLRNPPTGENHKNSKLTEKDVLEILRMASVPRSDVKTARHFGINPETVRLIRLGRAWKHVDRRRAV